MLLSVKSWDPLALESEAPETLSGQMLAILLLSPHNQNMGGLTAENWEVITPEEDYGTCRCTLLREQQELLEQYTRGAKSGGTGEPGSQKVNQPAESFWDYEEKFLKLRCRLSADK